MSDYPFLRSIEGMALELDARIRQSSTRVESCKRRFGDSDITDRAIVELVTLQRIADRCAIMVNDDRYRDHLSHITMAL